MNRLHALLIAVAIALAIAAGTFAALRTTQLSATPSGGVTAAEIARQQAALHRVKIRLRHALEQRPPKLPPLPAIAKTPAPAAAPTPLPAAPAPAPAPSVAPTVVASAPHVRTSSSPVGSHSGEGDGESFDD
jgi:hypothetical protein